MHSIAGLNYNIRIKCPAGSIAVSDWQSRLIAVNCTVKPSCLQELSWLRDLPGGQMHTLPFQAV